jgi:hypothetical protein
VRVPVLRVASVRGARVLRPRLPTARFAVVRFAGARDVVARLVADRLALTFLAVVFFAVARFGVAFCGAARRRVDFVAVARVPVVLARAVPLRAARDVLFVPALLVAVPLVALLLVALLLVAVLAAPRFVAALFVRPFAAAMSAPLFYGASRISLRGAYPGSRAEYRIGTHGTHPQPDNSESTTCSPSSRHVRPFRASPHGTRRAGCLCAGTSGRCTIGDQSPAAGQEAPTMESTSSATS